MGILGKVKFNAPVSDSAKGGSRALDVCGKILSLSEQQDRMAKGKQLLVADMKIVDDSNAGVVIAVWENAYDLVASIPIGEGVTLIGCMATQDPLAGFKLSLWESAHVIRGGDRAQSLTSMSATRGDEDFPTLTATFAPTHTPITVEGEAFPSCAAALAEASTGTHGLLGDKLFQINRCILDAPTSEQSLLTQDGQRLFIRCTIYDWTGAVAVDVIEVAAPSVFGLASKEAVLAAARDQSLAVELRRVNVRGVLRQENGTLKKYIAAIVPSPLTTVLSARAMRATLGLADVAGSVVQVAPVARLIDCPVQGFALATDEPGSVSAHRVLLFVQGTLESSLEPLDPECPAVQKQSFRVTSSKARCLLSEADSEMFVDLHGYCNFKTMLQYRLDTDCALVLASALTVGEDRERAVTVEFMQKVTEPNKESLRTALGVEWRTALTNIGSTMLDGYSSPMKPEYWNEPQPKVRRLESDPKSPSPRSA